MTDVKGGKRDDKTYLPPQRLEQWVSGPIDPYSAGNLAVKAFN
jgi:hypothetical protein